MLGAGEFLIDRSFTVTPQEVKVIKRALNSGESSDADKRHLTTRRGFVTVVGFGVLSLYGLWAAYGAAPISLVSMPSGEGGGDGMEGMAGMGHGGGGMSPEEFRRLAEEFIEANELPDGSVKPVRRAGAAMSAAEHENEAEHEEAAHGHEEEHEKEREAADVYLMASRYSYEPSVLRLELNVPYRFRMMAMDTNHGYSITMNVGIAGHMMRVPARTLAEMVMTFTKPGDYLIYCTVYCGEGHDMMQGKIIVA